MRTLIDSATSNRPDRRTALIAQQLLRFSVDIAALSETRLAGEGSLREIGSQYTFFWKGKDQNERRIHGVGFAIKSSLVDKYNLSPTALNERLITIRIPMSRNQHMTIISAYAPTMNSADIVKEEFYSTLNSAIRAVPSSDKLFLLGDFNARVGCDSDLWHGVLGKHGVGNCNDNGRLLLGFCAENELTITNTCFRLATRKKNNLATSKVQAMAHVGLCHHSVQRSKRRPRHQSNDGG